MAFDWYTFKLDVDNFFSQKTTSNDSNDESSSSGSDYNIFDDGLCSPCREDDESVMINQNMNYDGMEINEVDYDISPSPLFQLIQAKEWDRVIEMCKDDPEQACIWVYRVHDGKKRGPEENNEGESLLLRWKILPIHASIIFRCPPDVLEALIEAYPKGVEMQDDEGNLPIHLAFMNKANDENLTMLLEHYPDGANVKDNHGKTPSELARGRRRWIRSLTKKVVSNNRSSVLLEGQNGHDILDYEEMDDDKGDYNSNRHVDADALDPTNTEKKRAGYAQEEELNDSLERSAGAREEENDDKVSSESCETREDGDVDDDDDDASDHQRERVDQSVDTNGVESDNEDKHGNVINGERNKKLEDEDDGGGSESDIGKHKGRDENETAVAPKPINSKAGEPDVGTSYQSPVIVIEDDSVSSNENKVSSSKMVENDRASKSQQQSRNGLSLLTDNYDSGNDHPIKVVQPKDMSYLSDTEFKENRAPNTQQQSKPKNPTKKGLKMRNPFKSKKKKKSSNFNWNDPHEI